MLYHGMVDCFFHNHLPMKGYAFFDFDGTITLHDTFIAFGKFSLGRYRFIFGIIKALPWLFLWKTKIVSNSVAKQRLFGFWFKGMEYTMFKRYGYGFVEIIDSRLNEVVVEKMKMHLQNGDYVAIVSASIGDWIRPWAEIHEIDEVISTEIEIDNNGFLTGKFSTPNCNGMEKARRISNRFPKIDLMTTYAYGDSDGDMEMFNIVKHPHKI